MQERLIREMAKLRGGPAKLKVLCHEYEELIEALEKERDQIVAMRDLICELTAVEEGDQDTPTLKVSEDVKSPDDYPRIEV